MKEIIDTIIESKTARTKNAINIMKEFIEKYGEAKFIDEVYKMFEDDLRQGVADAFAKKLKNRL